MTRRIHKHAEANHIPGPDTALLLLTLHTFVHVRRRAEAEGITKLGAMVADVYRLPFADASFDAIYLITVIGEIPKPKRAMREFYRVPPHPVRWPSVNY